jgi:ADP-ribose pyrophosphatase YjhB (NUDIX family)
LTVHQDGYVKFIRERVGHELIYLVYSVGIVRDDAGHILVQRRYEFDWWDLVGGAKELDETISQCMIREAREESGLDIEIERLVGIYTHPDYTIQYPHGDRVQPWAVCFLCRAVGGEIRPDGKETLSAQFKPLDDLLPHPHQIFDDLLRDAFFSPNGGVKVEPPIILPDAKPFFPVLREHIKREPIILPGAIALIRDEAGRILVTKRSAFDSWDLPSGFSDLGETVTQTTVREVLEETGLHVTLTRILGVYSDPALMYGRYPNGDEVYGVGALMECRVDGGSLRADGTENVAAEFLSPDEIRRRNGEKMRPLTHQLLNDIEHLGDQPFIR